MSADTLPTTSVELRDAAQDLYDGLTCWGIRGDLWPAGPGDPDDHLGNRLEDAFCTIDAYIAELRRREEAGS
jgi:hypothetical protein